MAATIIKELFATDIDRNIEEVIKVDQTDEQLVRAEIAEYVATDSIRSHFRAILDRYAETPNKPHEGIGVWVSGFFGSGKSSFAKYLGLALEKLGRTPEAISHYKQALKLRPDFVPARSALTRLRAGP